MAYSDLNECANVALLALTVWREARGEAFDCKLAIAYSIKNRIDRRQWWGDTILTVVGKRLQYSSMTRSGDPNLVQWPKDNDSSWGDSLLAANAALNNLAANPAPGSDSYFDTSISPPAWAKPEQFVKQIGHVRFYDLDRDFEKEAGTQVT